ncbi:MAG: hypothetical protein ACP5U1_17610, partial [Desulfomonilaceae bacterium]
AAMPRASPSAGLMRPYRARRGSRKLIPICPGRGATYEPPAAPWEFCRRVLTQPTIMPNRSLERFLVARLTRNDNTPTAQPWAHRVLDRRSSPKMNEYLCRGAPVCSPSSS